MASGLNFIVLLCLISGLWTEANAQCGKAPGFCETCPPGWTQFDQRCYIFYNSEKDWADAERFCTSLDGNLASIRSENEYKFLREMVYRATNSHKRTWVGGYDAVKEGLWLWSDGSKFNFTGWAKGEPNNHGDEGCMEINLRGEDFVNDARCKEKNSFICARNP
ncbi:galactose-specific lectin nattectin-like [Thunnus maccoyii]|uniref:galactose-specific lectin nattectin-like n=1 Tax=Thunnus maccoyii TaxID=8240 RepID=UPI001C4BE7F4|nr:galactose-specific lectin nattectin-like [Thunnus maccoyii]XP_042265652.1 galactose-specific lectin nattectin-like [Thunnus maccoyii]XP_042265653.1 galactose-specific lectin nattectin-like [Thunnus maccoyii]XP_042265654.1 galactose-specific lectin nattectin-like [Thunnus maccoyii]XP_042265655.1 galactose-specific lectin nattectin-like [Thunnus maccoyii]XP_042265657.1 galactose-specific lectin nattectin-like [Thunnus maccoyii]